MSRIKIFKSNLILIVLILGTIGLGHSQNPLTSFSIENINNYSDSDLAQFYDDATNQGYTLGQLKALAAARGVSQAKIREFEERIDNFKNDSKIDDIDKPNPLAINDYAVIPNNVNSAKEKASTSAIFGLDFFSNENLNFVPNLNLTTPVNYIIGPGDEFVINVWGAAERVYKVEVDREGAIRIPNVGPIFLNGTSIDDAQKKITNALKSIYSGIGSNSGSPYKTNIDISLSKVRTISVNVIGEAKNPGTYNVSSLSTILNVLYVSGGPNDNGTLRSIKLIRDGVETGTFDLYNFLINGQNDGSITLKDQDVILIKPYISRVTVTGASKRIGIFELKETESFNELLQFTGGFKSDAFRERFILERIEGDGRLIKEIEYQSMGNFLLKDGDIIRIKEALKEYKNRVEIIGAVNRPGFYEFVEGLTINDLLTKANGIRDNAFINRGVVIRNKYGLSKEAIPFEIDTKDGLVKPSLSLLKNDVVNIYDAASLKEEEYITITGAVNDPLSIKFIDNLSIEDLVLMAGGYKNGADPNKVDIFRYKEDNNSETLSESIETKVSLDLRENSIKLLPNDRVSIRYNKAHSEPVSVSILGQINYPGNYSLNNKSDKISDIIIKAGGLTDYAYAQGATLKRKNPYYKEGLENQEVIDASVRVNEDSGEVNINNPEYLSVGIDLAVIMKNPDDKGNLLLKDGDQIVIPSLTQTVRIEGEILVPSLVRYDKLYNLRDYVNSAGGFSSNAKKRKAYVIHLSGEIESTKSFLFFRKYPKIEAGSVISIPKKQKSKGAMSAQEVIALSSGVASFALLIDRLFAN